MITHLPCWVAVLLVVNSASAQSIQFEPAPANLATGGPAYGVAVADYDGDGQDDLYIAALQGGSKLFRTTGNWTFEDVTTSAGVTVAGEAVNPLWGDIDNDGHPDLFVGVRSYSGKSSKLFLNRGDGTFADITVASGIDTTLIVGTAAFGDYDGDGRLDLFVATRDSYDRLYRNTGENGPLFEDVAGEVNVLGFPQSIAMQATWTDYDQDGMLDLFAVHDGNLVSRLYRQTNGHPRFQHQIGTTGLAVSRSAMGVAWGDYDNDGWDDVYVTNIAEANLFRNRGDGTFEDVTAASGAGRNGMAWGTVFADFDNDGDLDLFAGNTFGYDASPAMLYENEGGIFTDRAAAAGAALRVNVFGVATGDFDQDGRIDLVVANEGGQNALLLNKTAPAGAWLQLHLIGETANHMAIGARIRVVAAGVGHQRTVDGGSSYASQSSPTLHVGLGEADRVDTLQVIWTDGSVQTLTDLPANTRYTLAQGGAVNVSAERESTATFALSLYPNPVVDRATLTFSLDKSAPVTVELVDVLGRRLRTWSPGTLSAGAHQIAIDRAGLPAGVYLIRWRAGASTVTRTVLIV
ncbi:MAG: FG-GAP-like repeat-containing protein [Rhodothermales bacterium]|nr:FG-GAP-like repeat-containing protein [Rhodothermales bacterium]